MAEIRDCIASVVHQMSDEEKGQLFIILEHGKGLEKNGAPDLTDSQVVTKAGRATNVTEIAQKMDWAFRRGLEGVPGIDAFRVWEYGKQLDITIQDIFISGFKVTAPQFKEPAHLDDGAIEREQWIVEALYDVLWTRLPEETKRHIAMEIEQLMRQPGMNAAMAEAVRKALLGGAFSSAFRLVGMRSLIMVPQVAHLMTPTFIGGAGAAVVARGPLAALGPVGLAVGVVSTIPFIADLVNPRAYDKYLPAVFLIGTKRLELDGLRKAAQ